MKKIIIILSITLIAALGLFPINSPEKDQEIEVPQVKSVNTLAAEDQPEWWNRLYTPTQITKLGDKHFIVDCWHNRVIWSYDLETPIEQWGVVDSELGNPHSIDSDGRYYAVENTNYQEVRFYEFTDGSFTQVDALKNLGLKPHRVRYDHDRGFFIVLSADSGIMYHIKMIDGKAQILSEHKIPMIDYEQSMHIRSFSIIDEQVIFTATPAQKVGVIITDLDYNLIRTIVPADDFKSMDDVFEIDGKLLVTATPNAITVLDSIDQIATAKNVHEKFGFKGTPYYFSMIDGELFIPEIGDYSRISRWSFDGELKLEQIYFDFGAPTEADKDESIRLVP